MNKLILVLALLCRGAYADDIEDIMANYGKKDYATAITKLKKTAEQGDAQAQNNLGLMYANGQDVTQDYAEAVKWYRLSVAQGDAQAQNNLGLMYANGQGVTQDYAEAAKWYRLSMAQGNAQAQDNLRILAVKEVEVNLRIPRPSSPP